MALFSRAASPGFSICSGISLKHSMKERLFLSKRYAHCHLQKNILHRKHSQPGLRYASGTSEGSRRLCISFNKMIEARQDQAQRSVLVQVHSGHSFNDLYSHCSQFGSVANTLYYTTSEDLHFILVEFAAKEEAKKLMESSSYGTRIPAVPVSSPFLWLRASDNKTSQKGESPVALSDSEASPLVLQQLLQDSDSVSHQIEVLYRSTCLGDLGSRLRFLTARQLELAVSGMFPFVKALPFGSSVNGFGRAGCDLDLVLQLGGLEEGQLEDRPLQENSRLVFHSKGSSACNGRAQLQRHMETLADLINLFLPGCSKVVRILQARVPIIRFHHDLTMLECDLSMTNMTALHMSEMLFLMGEADERVRPLVFCVRRWAQAVGLTNPSPGRWVSNFSLTLLTIFYLQTQQVLPSLGTLIQLAGDKDRRITADGINCTFLRDFSYLALSKNESSLKELLKGFFDFYSSFDFGGRGMSLVTGKPMLKSDHSPLYIENPLERSLNVSKNVSPEETLRLRVEMRNAAWLIEQQEDEPEDGRNSKEPWGLLRLLLDPKRPGLGQPQPKAHRLVHVRDLFSKENFVHNKSNVSKSNKALRERRR